MSTNYGKNESNILSLPLQDEGCWSLAVCKGLEFVMYQAATLCAVMPQACSRYTASHGLLSASAAECTTNAILQPDRKLAVR